MRCIRRRLPICHGSLCHNSSISCTNHLGPEDYATNSHDHAEKEKVTEKYKISKIKRAGTAKHTCGPSTREAEGGDRHDSEDSLGYGVRTRLRTKNNKKHTQFSKNPFAFIPAEIQKGWPHNRHCCFCLVAPKSLSSLSEEKQITLPMYTQGYI